MAQDGALDGKLVVLIGGSGFFGTRVAQALLTQGARLRIASRHPSEAFALRRGELVDQGTHEDLLTRSADYRRIFARYE